MESEDDFLTVRARYFTDVKRTELGDILISTIYSIQLERYETAVVTSDGVIKEEYVETEAEAIEDHDRLVEEYTKNSESSG